MQGRTNNHLAFFLHAPSLLRAPPLLLPTPANWSSRNSIVLVSTFLK